uniref:Transmembrane protein 216 n=1 Tax=Molossus molossus TaxID=27622 RepID=A0A7J8EVC7_MOLMO|nr:transmembrane protein 216 [Molossus molossus]
MLLLYLGIEVIRLFFGTKGNLCQRKMPLAISVALTFPSAVMASYYLLLQTYVLRLEAIMNGILLFFCGSELLLEYGQDLKYRNVSQQPSVAETTHTSGTLATPVRNLGHLVLGEVAAFPQHRCFGQQPKRKATGHHLLNRTISLRDSSTLQYREGHGCPPPGHSQNPFPADLSSPL